MKAKERIMSVFIRSVIKAETFPWPPVCIGVIYQPERPVTTHKGNTGPSLRPKNK